MDTNKLMGTTEPYGWLGGALYLNKVSNANGLIGASWRVAVDHSLVIEATSEGYTCKDAQKAVEVKVPTLKAARVLVNEWLQARPAAQGTKTVVPDPFAGVEMKEASTTEQPKAQAPKKGKGKTYEGGGIPPHFTSPAQWRRAQPPIPER